MGTIFSGTGLVSGLDISGIVEKLIAVEARPRDLLLQRIKGIDAQRTAYLDISARISALLTRVNSLATRSIFEASSITNSNPEALSVTANDSAAPGAYQFIVRSLASTQQVVSQGIASRTQPLGSGSFTIESAQARVTTHTRLDELNGYAGVRRGSFQLTDAAGKTAKISIHDALTLDDVTDRINAAGLAIRAEVRGDAVVLTETTGGALHIDEVDGGRTAADLGFAAGNRAGTGSLQGAALVKLSNVTPLSALNDGNGLRRAKAGGDFSINGMTVDLSEILKDTTRLDRLNQGNGVRLGRVRVTTIDSEGTETKIDIDLSTATTVGDVKRSLEQAVSGLTVTLSSNRLIVGTSASTGSPPKLKIEDLEGFTAQDLGITGNGASNKISGTGVLLVRSMADVLAAVNKADTNDGSIVASLGAHGIVINAAETANLAALNGSNALKDLGLAEGAYTGPATGSRIIGGINSVLLKTLNGGSGYDLGQIQIDAGGTVFTVDLAGSESLADVVQRINSAAAAAAPAVGLKVGYDSTGTKLLFDTLNGDVSLTISDVSGNFAASSGIAATGTQIKGGNLQRRYISEATQLADLASGRGVTRGKFKITDSKGISATIDIGDGTDSLRDVIEKINTAGVGVQASINPRGDGLLLRDTAGGELAMKVEEDGSATAHDLNILGDAVGGVIDGSFELTFTISGSDTLDSLTKQINDRGLLASASVLNDGTGVLPFRLNVAAQASGLRGELILDGSAMGLDFTTLTRAQDATVILGNNPEGGLLVTSSSNTVADAVPGLTLDLLKADEKPVTVTIARDFNSVLETMKGFVESFNSAVKRIRDVGGYDAETETAGVLFGEGTLQMVESRLFRAISATSGTTGGVRRLADVGIRIASGEITFDEDKFRLAYDQDPEGVIRFFTTAETGIAASLKTQIERITDENGLISRREGSLEKEKELFNDRVTRMNAQLSRKQERLTRQFLAMEQALAQLQTQQSALTQLSALAANSGSTS